GGGVSGLARGGGLSWRLDDQRIMEEGEEKRESKVRRRKGYHEDVVRQFVAASTRFVDCWSAAFAARGSLLLREEAIRHIHEVAVEGETGKVYRAEFQDREGRTVLVLRPGKQIVKYFLDPKTFQKVKFVYPKNEESMGVMHKNFDPEILPEEFGGKSKVEYDHDEFSKLMSRDDVKTASFWKLDEKKTTLVAPEPAHFVAQAS
ncbi:hypothetical protein GW17_00008128, partial [Ensete ventricosum]